MSESSLKSKFSGAVITHAVFVVFYLLVILAQIVIPRYINAPNLQIQNTKAIAGEQGFRFDIRTLADVIDALHESEGGIYFFRSRCEKQISLNRIDSNCEDSVVEILEGAIQKLDRKASKNKKDLDFFDDLVGSPIDEVRTKIKDANLETSSMVELVIMGEAYMKDTVKDAVLGGFVRIRSRKLSQKADRINQAQSNLTDTLEMLEDSFGSPRNRSGDIVFEIIVLNDGYADGLVLPDSDLKIAGHVISLNIVRSLSEVRSDVQVQHHYEFVKSGSMKRIFFAPNRFESSKSAITALDSMIKSGQTSNFRISLNSNEQTITASSHLPSTSHDLRLLTW